MSTIELLRPVHVHDPHVDLGGGGISVSGHPVPDDLLVELQTHQGDVLAMMRKQRIGELHDSFDCTTPRCYVIPSTWPALDFSRER